MCLWVTTLSAGAFVDIFAGAAVSVSFRFYEAIVKIVDICVATVEGDIHDIGKNIVKLLLSNYGFNVIDLGQRRTRSNGCRCGY